jgi:hypothetical protein
MKTIQTVYILRQCNTGNVLELLDLQNKQKENQKSVKDSKKQKVENNLQFLYAFRPAEQTKGKAKEPKRQQKTKGRKKPSVPLHGKRVYL